MSHNIDIESLRQAHIEILIESSGSNFKMILKLREIPGWKQQARFISLIDGDELAVEYHEFETQLTDNSIHTYYIQWRLKITYDKILLSECYTGLSNHNPDMQLYGLYARL
jgi:hypothetical protein